MVEKAKKETFEFPTTIHGTVAKRLTEIAPLIEERIVNIFVERDVVRYGDAIVAVMDKMRDLQNQLRRIAPDQVVFNEKREVVSSGYSKAKLDEKQKLEEQIEKHTKAINKCFAEKPDFSDCLNLAGKGGGNQQT